MTAPHGMRQVRSPSCVTLPLSCMQNVDLVFHISLYIVCVHDSVSPSCSSLYTPPTTTYEIQSTISLLRNSESFAQLQLNARSHQSSLHCHFFDLVKDLKASHAEDRDAQVSWIYRLSLSGNPPTFVLIIQSVCDRPRPIFPYQSAARCLNP